jgi:hypothetical protein
MSACQLPVCLPLCMSHRVVCVSICQLVCPSFCLSLRAACMSLCHTVCIFYCRSVCMSADLSVYISLPICQPVYMFLCRSLIMKESPFFILKRWFLLKKRQIETFFGYFQPIFFFKQLFAPSDRPQV